MIDLIGGPDRDRTDDLFHAMEARSQLRHRPTYSGLQLPYCLRSEGIRQTLARDAGEHGRGRQKIHRSEGVKHASAERKILFGLKWWPGKEKNAQNWSKKDISCVTGNTGGGEPVSKRIGREIQGKSTPFASRVCVGNRRISAAFHMLERLTANATEIVLAAQLARCQVYSNCGNVGGH